MLYMYMYMCMIYVYVYVYILTHIIINIIGIISTISAYFRGLTSQHRIEVGPAAVASGDLFRRRKIDV